MATKQVKLQHSTFDLQYDAHKHWTHDDSALIAAVEKLVAHEVHKNKISDDKYYAHAAFKKQAEPVEAEFIELTNSIKNLIKQTDEFEPKLIGFNTINIDALITSLNEAGAVITGFHQKLLPLSDIINTISPPINEEEEDEAETQLAPEWKHFNETKDKHFKHWEHQSIDISSFDDLEERMRAGFDYLEKRNDNNRYFINDIILNYNVFIAKVDGIYVLWEEVQKRIVLLNRFVNSTDSIEKIQKLN